MWRPSLKPPLEVLWAADVRLESFHQRQKLYQWSSLAFCLRHDRFQRDVLSYELSLYKELILEMRLVPPLGLTMDLFALLRQGELFSPRRLTDEDHPFERVLLRIQNDLLYRLSRFPRFRKLRQALLRLSTEVPETERKSHLLMPLSLQERALVYIVAQLYQPVREWLVEGFRPHPLPPFSSQPPDWWEHPGWAVERFEALIEREGWVSEQLQTLLDHWIRLSESDWLETGWEPILAHFDLLHNKLERVRWQQMAWSFDRVETPKDPRTLFQLRDEGYHQIHLPSRSIVPEGGLLGLSRRGELSSLLPSELLYWDRSASVDLFLLRLVERELLYYEREQDISFSWQRRLQIVLCLDVGEVRYKSAAMKVPGTSLLFGLLSRLTVDLRQVCPEEVLRIEYYLTPEEQWESEAPTYQLFLSSMAQVGGSTSLHLLPDASGFLEKQPPGSGDFRLLITTPSLWKGLEPSAQKGCHLSLCWSPSRRVLEQHKITGEENFEVGMGVFQGKGEKPKDKPTKPRTSTQVSLSPLLPKQPDLIFVAGETEDCFVRLASLRDAMLQSILKAPPHMQGTSQHVSRGEKP